MGAKEICYNEIQIVEERNIQLLVLRKEIKKNLNLTIKNGKLKLNIPRNIGDLRLDYSRDYRTIYNRDYSIVYRLPYSR